jgi:hypothetical protein
MNINQIYVTTYEDWLLEKISGDFAHVMHISLFEGLPFFEEIRGFPGVNFLKIHLKSKRQLLYEFFEEDFIRLNKSLYKKKNIKNIFLGIAIREFETNKQIIEKLKRSGISIFSLNIMNNNMLPPVVYYFIKFFSR